MKMPLTDTLREKKLSIENRLKRTAKNRQKLPTEATNLYTGRTTTAEMRKSISRNDAKEKT
jgi:hypothetical protein